MMKKIRIITGALIALFMAAVPALPAAAAAVAAAGFSVAPVIPDSQRSGVYTYFDLDVQPGVTQELAVIVTNPGEADITVKVDFSSAVTNSSGDISYTQNLPEGAEAEYMLSNIATTPEEYVTVPAGSETEVPFTITTPGEDFAGLVMGTIRVLKEATEEERAAAGMLVNQYAHSLVIVLRQNQEAVIPDFQLDGVSAELVDYRATIVANIRNPLPAVFSDALASATVFEQDTGETLFEVENQSIDFVPYTVFPFSFVDEEGYGFDPGNYGVNISLTYREQTWSFEDSFVIEAEAAAEINERSVNQIQRRQAEESSVLWIIVAIVAGVLVVAAVVVIVMRQNMKYKKLLSEKGAV